MKTQILFFLLGIQPLLWANPIDITPITQFSELVFDDNNHWTMELLIPYNIPDSIILKVSNNEAKLKITLIDGIDKIYLITPDSLSTPLTINRDGDQIELDTYSSLYGNQLRIDWLSFGNVIGASVGQPFSGYSIMRNTLEAHDNQLAFDCLTKNPSLGAVNDTTGLGATLKGRMFDTNHNPVTKYMIFPVSPCYFELQTPLDLESSGGYSTRIFRRFEIDTISSFGVRLDDFDGWSQRQRIEPFILKNIHPDTTVVQDIYLKSNEYIDTDVNINCLPKNKHLEVINYPNPFNSSTNFLIKVPNEMKGKTGDINIFNVKGEQIISIPFKDGASVTWDGKDNNGRAMPSGKFYYHLDIDNKTMQTGSMILLK